MYEYIIWLEIHIKLHTKHKIFCHCENTQDFDNTTPNTHICPTCTAQPGGLPLINPECINTAIRLWHIFNAELNKNFSRDRKSYFYPDSPTGFQITQFHEPIIKWGQVHFYTNNFQTENSINIHEAHLENDTAKTITIDGTTYIDFNRSGGPLLEIVTKPEFTSDDQVIEFLKELQRIIRRNDIGYADLEKGQMRVDVNLSVKPMGSRELGVRNEVKNLNSFASIRKAIAHEYQRHTNMINNNQIIEQETRWRDDTKWETYTLRSKEHAHDYRYFPEGNLPRVNANTINRNPQMDITSWYKRIKLLVDFGFHKEYIHGLLNNEFLYEWFSIAYHKWFDAKLVAKRLMWPIASIYNEGWENNMKLTAQTFIDFLDTITKNTLNDMVAKKIMQELIEKWGHPWEIATQYLSATIDEKDILSIIDTIIQDNPKALEDYKWGKLTTIAFFVWQLMKVTKWSLDASVAKTMFEKKLNN